MKNAIILARVSTKRQEEEGLSLKDIQLPVLRTYAKDNGFTVAEKDEFVFQESADSKIRKKFDEMIEYVRKNKNISAIITYRVDRITRNFRDAVSLDNLTKEYDKEIHFVNDRLVINKQSSGRDIQDWDLKVFLAKQTINRLKDYERISRKRKLENGELPGRALFGYKNITRDDKKKWVIPDEKTDFILKEIFEWYASGNYSFQEISQQLKFDYGIEKSKGAIQNIIRNRFYIGFIYNEGKVYPHHYEQIIDKDTFDKAQAVADKRIGAFKRFKYAGKEFAYRGLLRCETCNCMITPQTKKRKLKDGTFNYHTYYHCTNYHKIHKKLKHIKESKIDSQFATLFENLKLPPEEAEKLVTTLKQSHTETNYFFDKELKFLRTEQEKYKNRIRVAYNDRLDGCITMDGYEEIRKENQDKVDNLTEKIVTLDQAEKEYYITTAYLVEIASRASEIFLGSKPHEKRALLNFVLSNQTLDGDLVRYEAKYPFDRILKYGPRQAWLPD